MSQINTVKELALIMCMLDKLEQSNSSFFHPIRLREESFVNMIPIEDLGKD